MKNTPATYNPEWRRKGWSRFIVYLFGLLLVIHLLHSLTSDWVFLNQATTATARRREGFPWYTKEHADIPISNKHTTVHLSDAEREKLHNKMVTKATKAIEHVYPKNTFKSFIPGTNYISKNTTALREKVDCWTRGRWVKREGATLSPLPHFQDPHYGTCDRKYKHKGGESEWRPALHYEWEPECLMTEHLDSLQWCQIINGKNMLVVGDLVHYQLHDLILDSLRDGPAICFGELNCKDHSICSDPNPFTRLRYVRNDILSLRRRLDMKKGHPRGDVIEWPFAISSIIKNYPILILNRAPVLETDDQFIRGLIDTVQFVRDNHPETLIIYKSTSIGHPHCDDATEPLEKHLTDAEQRQLPFGWSELSRRNAMARAIVEGAGGVFIDLAALTDLRPDGHIGGQDCLRYCLPGPLDSWAQILYHVFLALEGQVPL